jgi:hypothetical protein
MATSEIEKLERRYAENPHGLTFAPLAEVHRKNGDLARALELLRIGLELHPNYIPASIVLGRCHQDLGDFPAAEEAFAHVLRLDDENVIALKSLGDINERQNRLEDAERWLRRLVSVDRSNDEARQQLQRIEEARKKEQESGSVQAPAPQAPVSPAPAAATTSEEAPKEPPAQPPAPVAQEAPEPEIAALELTEEIGKEAVVEKEAVIEKEPVEAAAEPAHIEHPAPLAGLETTEFQPPTEPAGSPLGLEIETESDVVLNSSGASEFSVPDASEDFAALAAKMNAARPRNPGRRATDRPVAEVRETDTRLPSVPIQPPAAPLAPPVPAPLPASPGPTTKYSVRDTKGRSVGTFFQELLAARPPSEQSGAQSSSGPGSQENRVSSVSSGTAKGNDLLSFDDFFGSPAGGNSGGPEGEPGKDDLDQFHSWLQNLKR